MDAITTSIFDIFKIGPGPSSSHTIGPLNAGYDFLQTIKNLPAAIRQKADKITVILSGSLSATGKGHGTDRAVLGGLLGVKADTCPPSFLNKLLSKAGDEYSVTLPGKTIRLTEKDIIFSSKPIHSPYHNTLTIKLLAGKEILFEREYYSVGGGFIKWKGQKRAAQRKPVYRYTNTNQLKKLLEKNKLLLPELVLANEQAISGLTIKQIKARIKAIINTMENSVKRGIKTEGILPGKLHLHRKAPALYKQAKKMSGIPDHFLTYLCAYAFAAAEENAVGQPIVTAPTCGSAGIIPSIIYVMNHHLNIAQKNIINGFLAAAALAFIVKHNASIAGADVGCQGEIGVAALMAAAMTAYARTAHFQTMENAAETALEHHLGLTCDPVGGYVQIPCIERNAMGSVKAYSAFLIATAEVSRYHMVSLDAVIKAMAATGRDMKDKYRETSRGGLAVTVKC